MSEPETLYVVDGSGFIFRAYHALPPLTTRAGVPSGAVYGFTNMLIKLEGDYRPAYLAVIFDGPGKSFRDELYTEYKANRDAPPDDLIPQFASVKRVVEAFGVPVMESQGCEADDLIAALVKQARARGLRSVVVSSDKDLMQLVADDCMLVDTMKDPPKIYDAAGVVEKFGIPPAQLGDLLALMGDSVDNVPGVPGVGPKTASALISHFGSLDALYARLDEVPALKGLRGAASVKLKLEANAEAARLSRKLVALDENVPVPIAFDALKRHQPDMARVEGLLRELEFNRLIDRLKAQRGERPSESAPAVAQAPKSEPAAAPTAAAPPAAAPPVVGSKAPAIGARPTEVVLTEARLTELAAEAARAPSVGIVIESSGGPTVSAAIVGIALAWPEAAPVYLPVGHRYLGAPAQLDVDRALALLRPLLSGAQPKKQILDSKDAEILLARHGIPIGGIDSDPRIDSYLLDPSEDHELPALCVRRLGAVPPALDGGREGLLGKGKKAIAFDSLEIERAAAFSGSAAEATLVVGRALSAELRGRGLAPLLDEMEMPLAHVLAVMERHGICLDVAMLHALGKKLDERLRALEDEVRTLTGSEVNLGSPKQLQELLFDKLGLPAGKRTKTGFSVDAEVLEELAPLHPVAAKILEHRTLAKLKGTYVDALPLLVDPRSGRLHTSYKQTVASTGRLSSVDPNLQNVPIRSELGLEIRRAFRADKGCLLVVGDYSQIELRVLAHLSQDPVLIDAFRKDEDIHRRTVAEMFGPDKADDPQLRSVAKMINYGIVYGLSDFGLAQRLGIERKDAKQYIEGYLKTYARVNEYMESLIRDAYRDAGARTLFGRWRPLPELASKNRNIRMAGERMARNTPIQGTAADLLKLAMIKVQNVLDEEAPAVKMLLTVHDELVLEAPEPGAEAIGERLRQVMEGVTPLDVPLKVDLGVGVTWADAK